MNSNAISGMLGTIHGELRWVFALIAVLGIARTVYGLIRNTKFSNVDSRLALVYSILLILYLGLSKLGSFSATFTWVGWHPVWMLAAVVVGHLGAGWKKAPDQKRFQIQLTAYLASLGLIFVGVMTSPLAGWT
jgi:CDP-diglyceride synthetase